ncbi:unnamed protein product, partial [Rotaria sordida]
RDTKVSTIMIADEFSISSFCDFIKQRAIGSTTSYYRYRTEQDFFILE